MIDPLSRGVELAKCKHDLHVEINDLTEHDSVVLIIGSRYISDESGREVSHVRTVERNSHGFESIGLVEAARRRFRNYYEVND